MFYFTLPLGPRRSVKLTEGLDGRQKKASNGILISSDHLDLLRGPRFRLRDRLRCLVRLRDRLRCLIRLYDRVRCLIRLRDRLRCLIRLYDRLRCLIRLCE